MLLDCLKYHFLDAGDFSVISPLRELPAHISRPADTIWSPRKSVLSAVVLPDATKWCFPGANPVFGLAHSQMDVTVSKSTQLGFQNLIPSKGFVLVLLSCITVSQ